jgi:uncharacterized protein YchJ
VSGLSGQVGDPVRFEDDQPEAARILGEFYSRYGGLPFRIHAARILPGRNEPCSCGSGLKTKKCCGKG